MRGGELIYLRGSVLKGYNLQIPRSAEFIGTPLPFHYDPSPLSSSLTVIPRSFARTLSLCFQSRRCSLFSCLHLQPLDPPRAALVIAAPQRLSEDRPLLLLIMIIIDSELLDWKCEKRVKYARLATSIRFADILIPSSYICLGRLWSPLLSITIKMKK